MIKDILVHIPTERAMRPVVDGAIAVASAFGAHVDSVAVGYVANSTAYIMEGGAAVAAVFDMERDRAMERASAALAVFEAEAKTAGLSYSCRMLGEIPAEAAKTIGAMSRLYDLSVVLQPDDEQKSYDNDLPRDILFQCGGPVLFIPHVQRTPLKTKRIGLCWDGSRVAARALRDAMPFLQRADDIVITSINESPSTIHEASSEALARHLGRLGLPARIVALSAARAEIQPTILSLAADEALDLLVMGGYGHSRLQESFLGGVTRAMLQSMTVPTLMSH